MTRINTNVSSLNAQKTLARSNAMLQESLTRLSTGLRINTGKDDPAGLIASEVLRSDIIGVERAITNSERANQMIATADSALGQVSSLLNDIRGLISEAANTGAMSAEQIAANQLQIDSSLEAIDRIAQVTQFQGRRLLDGSLDFVTDGVDTESITDLQIDQANFGTQTEVGVAVEIVEQATQAELHYEHGAIADDVVLEIGGKNGFEAFNFAGGSTIEDLASAINLVADALGVRAEVQTEATQGSIIASSYGTDNNIVITAAEAGFDAGDIRVKYTADPEGNSTPQAVYTPPSGEEPGVIEVQLETQTWEQAEYTFGATDSLANNAFTLTAKQAGEDYNDYTFIFASTAAASISIDVSGKTITINDGTSGAGSVANLKTQLDANPLFSSMFTVTTSADGGSDTGLVDLGTFAPATYQTTQGVDGGAILSTANDVINMLNSEPTLDGVITASLAEGNDGHEVVTAFEESAYYGASEADNLIQFLGPEGSRNIRFVSEPGQELGIDMTTDPEVLDFASAVFQGTNADTSFKIAARQKGSEYDDVEVVINDSTTEVAVWDAQSKTLTLNVDLSGGATTLQDVINLVNTNENVSQYFRAETWGLADGTATFSDADLDTASVTLSGGVRSEGTLIVNLETNSAGLVQTTANDLIAFFNDTASHSADFAALGISVSNVLGSDGSGILDVTEEDIEFSTSGTDMQDANSSATITAANGEEAIFTITAKNSGPEYDGVTIEFEDTAAVGAETVTYDASTQTITVSINAGTTTAGMIVDIINGTTAGASDEVLELFTANLTQDIYGIPGIDSDGLGLLTVNDSGTFSGGEIDAGTSDGAALIGNEDQANVGLKFMAVEYGSDAFVSVRALNGTSFSVVDNYGVEADRSNGTDVDARINGIQAVGSGLTATLNTSSLDLTFSLAETVEDGAALSFRITGGGAQFQLGPDVVSNQQARLGISSVNTAKLGGVSGRLFELRSGGAKDLETDVIGAASVIEEVITQVTTLRGRLGAFQRTTLETNIASLSDTLEALTEAESSIRDADFAQESANLTKNQILVQSGISVLTIANQSPEAVLSLLQ